jgi:hypothetical protein
MGATPSETGIPGVVVVVILSGRKKSNIRSNQFVWIFT